MNQGRIWTVVSPNVGLPLFLGSVALMSFTVHFAVLSSTTWMSDFFNGVPMKKAEVTTEVAPNADVAMTKTPALAIEVAEAPALAGDEAKSFVLTIKPKTAAPDPS
jgi:light-harvesting protein B-800-850 alpha chain